MKVTREKVVSAARSFLATKYLHQGRNAATGIDCVGLLVLLGEKLNIPVEDLDNYKRVPSASTLLDYLRRNLDEISLDETGAGDILLLKMGGLKPRHTAVLTNENTLIHALCNGHYKSVVEHPVKLYRLGFTNGFRIRNLITE